METIIKELNKLEILAITYSSTFGPNCEEVKNIDKRIRELNLQLLDFMVEE